MVTGISHAREGDQFATCGENAQLWAAGRSVPLREPFLIWRYSELSTAAVFLNPSINYTEIKTN